ncbi:MAG: hypothetical protein JW934_00955 [Anaerolineae bacterium]|nr:hypothetical protein [Anaerolineae bacterium]
MKLYANNPHYIEFRGAPTVVVGSGEHYGAVLNLDFDYRPYLDALARDGLNQLRLFSGAYREIPGEFGIADNNLAPLPGRFICPWPERDGKFDLARFDEAYLARLHDFMRLASARRILVELVLFCFWYNEPLWAHSPLHPANNVQGAGPLDKERVYTLNNNPLLPVQEAMVRKLVTEVNGYDNVYFEICNEPYSRHDHTTYLDWQHHIVDLIVETESGLPNRHLIALNYQNRTQCIADPHPAVSICNFHYALPDAVKENRHLNRAIADDETGFAGQIAAPYRREAWAFMLAGGGLFGHLDYSFTCRHPDGAAPIKGSTPGYGGTDLRRQLAFLKAFLQDIRVWTMRPCNEIFAWNAGEVDAQALADPGRLYVIYFPQNRAGTTHGLSAPPGEYQLEWINPTAGRVFWSGARTHPGGYLQVAAPGHADDLVLKLTRQKAND